MGQIIRISSSDVMPSMAAVLRTQGFPPDATPDDRTRSMLEQSLAIFTEVARPEGILMEIRKDDFAVIYDGEGQNDKDAPLPAIAEASNELALFAVTLGERISGEISRLFAENEFALGSLLDSAASEGAEMAAEKVESYYRGMLTGTGRFDKSSGLMRFSPGYCGWHISGQRRLFERLRPESIGVKLRQSYLMDPLKSVSGVIVVGPRRIFQFDDDFSFCDKCQTHSCRDRIKAMMDDGVI